MGRKGVGKIAPLGICERIEILTSGGDLIRDGKARGYRTATHHPEPSRDDDRLWISV